MCACECVCSLSLSLNVRERAVVWYHHYLLCPILPVHQYVHVRGRLVSTAARLCGLFMRRPNAGERESERARARLRRVNWSVFAGAGMAGMGWGCRHGFAASTEQKEKNNNVGTLGVIDTPRRACVFSLGFELDSVLAHARALLLFPFGVIPPVYVVCKHAKEMYTRTDVIKVCSADNTTPNSRRVSLIPHKMKASTRATLYI